MARLAMVSLACLLALPSSAHAIQLRWADGSINLDFSQDTRAVLIVQADSAEATLPGQWTLEWLADSAGVNLAADSLSACLADTATASSIDPPGTPADSAAHLVIAHFCSAGSPSATAYYVLDQPGGSHGNLRVVALDPTDPDSSRVIESNEVTYNGGVTGSYSPVILRAERSHPSSQLRIEAVGTGFADAQRIEIAALDASWRLPLEIEARSDTKLTAVARVAADLPQFVLNLGGPSGGVEISPLPADTASTLLSQPACTNSIKEINTVSHEDIQPKDFTIVASRDSFHVFYTRQDYNLAAYPDLDNKIIGHKRSLDLYNWEPAEHTMEAVAARPGTWDHLHVWAPTIFKKPGDITYYMLYTGVDASGVQRIGVATSTDLNVWTQDAASTFESADVGWALAGTPEFRDPFVMPDPDHAGRYLLYFVTKTQARGRYVVGVARTDATDPANLRAWANPQPLWNTDSLRTGEAVIESPHAFKDPGNRWWLFYTGYNATSDPAYISFETNDVSPADTDTTHWSAPDTLYNFLGGDASVQYWHASEYYTVSPSYQYFGAFDDGQHSVEVAQVSWRGPHAFVFTDSCPPKSYVGVRESTPSRDVRLSVLGAVPSRLPIAFRIDVPEKMPMRLAIYDVAGRRVRTLMDEAIPLGGRVAMWDGRDALGAAVGPGVYFVQLATREGPRVAKLVLLR